MAQNAAKKELKPGIIVVIVVAALLVVGLVGYRWMNSEAVTGVPNATDQTIYNGLVIAHKQAEADKYLKEHPSLKPFGAPQGTNTK